LQSALVGGKDTVITGYRDHGHMLAYGIDPKIIMSELTGRQSGISHGKGGSMHMFSVEHGFYGGHGIVGAQVSLGAGLAFAHKYRDDGGVCLAYFGDGAANQGQVYESFNMASLWKLPVIYVIENNLYGASTHVELICRLKDLADRAAAYGIPGVVVDGNDVLEVHRVAGEAISRAREGKGPTLIEAKTYRIGGHSRTDANTYRRKEEEKLWLQRDPIRLFEARMLEQKILDPAQIQELGAEIDAMIEDAVERAQQAPDPSPDDALNYVTCEG